MGGLWLNLWDEKMGLTDGLNLFLFWTDGLNLFFEQTSVWFITVPVLDEGKRRKDLQVKLIFDWKNNVIIYLVPSSQRIDATKHEASSWTIKTSSDLQSSWVWKHKAVGISLVAPQKIVVSGRKYDLHKVGQNARWTWSSFGHAFKSLSSMH